MELANWFLATEEYPSASGNYIVKEKNEKKKEIFFFKKGEEVLLKRITIPMGVEEKIMQMLHTISTLEPIKEDGFYEIEQGSYGEFLIKKEDKDIVWSSITPKKKSYSTMKKRIESYKKEQENNLKELLKKYDFALNQDTILRKVAQSLDKEMLKSSFTYAGTQFKIENISLQKSTMEVYFIQKIMKDIMELSNIQEIYNIFLSEDLYEIDTVKEVKEGMILTLNAKKYPGYLVDLVTDSLFSFLYSSKKEDILHNFYCIENGKKGTRDQEFYLRVLLKYSVYNGIRNLFLTLYSKKEGNNDALIFHHCRNIAFYLILQKSQIIEFTSQFGKEFEL